MTEISFPQLGTRDLDGHEVTLPAGLPGAGPQMHPAQYRVLMPEHQQLSILRQITAEHQDG